MTQSWLGGVTLRIYIALAFEYEFYMIQGELSDGRMHNKGRLGTLLQ